MAEGVSLADGGVVTVLLGRGVDCPAEYLHHPCVRVVETEKFDTSDAERCFTSNSRAFLTTSGLPKRFYDRFQMEVRRRKSIVMYRPTTGSLENELRKIVATSRMMTEHEGSNGNGKGIGTSTVGEAAKMTEGVKKTIAPKNAIANLASQCDPKKSTAEEARRLFQVAQAQGLKTTLGSVTQAVSKYKRKHGMTDRPASAVAPEVNKRLSALRVLDDSIAGLALVREYVETVEAENQQLQEKLEKYRKFAAALSE